MIGSKEAFLNMQEYALIEVEREYYEQQREVFEVEQCTLKSIYARGKVDKNDQEYKEKLQRVIDARTELNEYEMEKRYKIMEEEEEEVSGCCGAEIIFSDICSECKEHI